jgi:hypothetical protein
MYGDAFGVVCYSIVLVVSARDAAPRQWLCVQVDQKHATKCDRNNGPTAGQSIVSSQSIHHRILSTSALLDAGSQHAFIRMHL